MSRDIKFRAWHKVKQKMEYEFYLASDNGGVLDRHLNDNKVAYDLMQYTGLKDKNGKEIYEGDIVKTYLGNIDVIEIKDTAGADFGCSVNGFGFKYDYNAYIDDDCEVIGNIYENGDLLK